MTATNRSKRRILFEMFIVITIIVITILFLIKFLEGGRESSRNISRISQIQEYQKAFNLLYSQTGNYPFAGEQTPTCLGSYPGKRCWKDSLLEESSLVSSSIVPNYMPRMPEGENRNFGEGGAYKGMAYIPGEKGKSYRIYYFMEGNNQSCIIAGASGSNNGFDTLCILKVP